MKDLSSWLITFFILIFWGFRVVVAVNGTLAGSDSIVKPIDNTTEIVLLFVVLSLVPFIFKRKILAALIYLVVYGWYFGRGLFTNTIAMVNGETLSGQAYLDMLVAFVAIVIALASVFDILIGKVKQTPQGKATEWYYKDKKYDRKLDERADKNNYRML